MIVWCLQGGRDVISERGRYVGGGADNPAEPGYRGDQQHTSAISSSDAPAASPPAHSRHIADDPMATDAPTCSSAAVSGFSARVLTGLSPS